MQAIKFNVMKRIFSIFAVCASVLLSGFIFAGCIDEMDDINEELILGRCMTPTELVAKIVDGEKVEFDWSKSKGASSFVLELYTDEQMSVPACDPILIPVAELPYLVDLEADMTYYARVKAVDDEEKIGDSNWANFSSKIETYAIKSSLNPKFVSSTLNSVVIKWTKDPEVDHIRITPALNADEKFTRFEVTSEAATAGQTTITGLKPSVKYTFAVHFKSADRGQVVAWTQPDTENAVRVTSIDEFKAQYANGQTKFVFAYSETPYEYGEFKVADFTHDLEIYGEPSEDGEFPTLLMNTKPATTVKKLHFERMHLCGAKGTAVGASNYFVNVQNVGQDIESITFLNCKITEFERALYYDNNNGKLGSLVIKDCVINTVKQSFIDSRQKGSSVFGSLLIENSTIQNVGNAFLRFAAGIKPSIIVRNNTIYNCGYASGHELGFISVADELDTFTMESNLIIGIPDVSGSKKNPLFMTQAAKTMNKNFFYDCYDGFLGDEKAAASATAGGAVLTENPVVDAVGGVFNVTDAAVKAAGAGDPRWLATYVEVPEDLTQIVTPTVTTWNLADVKIFRGQADKDMVRGNIRFYVKNTPFNLGDGMIEFTGKSTVSETGIPTDAGMGIKVDQPGSIVISTDASKLAGSHSHLTVSLNGEISASVPVGAEYQKITFPGISSESMIYITACDPIAITFLQWTSDVQVVNTVLDTPALTIDKTSVQERADDVVTVSWNAVDYAGAYEVTFNGTTKTVTETTYAIGTASLSVEETGADFMIAVKAVPAEDDYIRSASSVSEVSFHVNDVPIVDTGEIVDPSAITETYFAELNEAGGFAAQKFADGTGAVTVGKLTFGDKAELDGNRYKHGGASVLGEDGIPTNRYVSFKITRAGTISHKVISGSSSATDRAYAVALVTNIAGSKNVRVLYQEYSPTSSGADPVTTEVTEEMLAGITEAAVVYVYTLANCNTYAVGYDPVPAAPAKVDKVWDFSSSVWVDAMTGSGIAANTNDSNWNLEVDGLKVVSGGGSIKWNVSGETYFWQPGGKSDGTTRYFEFTTDVAGKLSVWASNTGSSEDLTRMVTVKVGDADPESLPGGYSSSDAPHQADFNIGKGTVKIYPTGNGLRFYKIEFHQN